jgi:hypothetical protein
LRTIERNGAPGAPYELFCKRSDHCGEQLPLCRAVFMRLVTPSPQNKGFSSVVIGTDDAKTQAQSLIG